MQETNWGRIVRDLSRRITDGETPVGSRIPSYQQLATRYGVSVGSTKRAVQDLMQRGIVEGHQGKGVFVTALPDEAGPTLEERVAELERRLAVHEAGHQSND